MIVDTRGILPKHTTTSNNNSYENINELKNKINNILTRETIASIIVFMGEEINRNYRFRDNPSMSISRECLIHDFGSSGFSGDIYSYIQETKSVSFVEAVKFVAECLGVRL